MIGRAALRSRSFAGKVRPSDGQAALAGERLWLAVFSSTVALELAWWTAVRLADAAPPPFLFTYLALALGGLCAAFALRVLLRPRAPMASRPGVLLGTLLFGIGGSLFLPLKFAIPDVLPFWLDRPLADADRFLFGADPWILLDRALGWAAVPIDWVYGLWLPVQSLVFFSLLIERPSPAKSRALISYSLAWLLLGVAAALALSSAGPLFFDRLLGGDRFALLGQTLRARGVSLAIGESDAMWVAYAHARPGLVSGISAMPSLHVAMSLWMALVARALAPRFAPLALGYFAFIWVASVQLGWHYASDGLAAAAGMLAIWVGAGAIERRARLRPAKSHEERPSC